MFALRLLLAVLGLAGVAGCAGTTHLDEASLAEVTRGPFVAVVESSAIMKASVSKQVAAPFTAIVEWLAPEGSMVAAGDPVARFDTAENRRKLREKLLARDLAVEDRKSKDLELELEEYELLNRLEFGKGDLELLRTTLRQQRTAVDPAELSRIEMALENSRNVQSNLEASRAEKAPYAEQGFVSRDEMATLEVQLAREKLEQRVLALEDRIARRGAKPEDIEVAARDVDVSTSALALLRVQADTFEARRLENARALEAKLESVKGDIAYLEGLISSAVVTAPIDGMVIYENAQMGGMRSEKVREGTRISEGAGVAEVVQDGPMKLEIKLAQRDSLRVRPGQPLTFIHEAYPDRVFHADITKTQQALMGRQLEPWIFPPVISMMATAVARGADAVLRPGMSCRVRIEVDRSENVLSVDSGAIGGDRVTLAGGEVRQVRTGRVGLTRTEILDGLAEGDRVRIPRAGPDRPPTSGEVVEVARGNLEVAVEASGQIEAREVTDVVIRDGDEEMKLVELAKDGTWVEKGAVVGRVDNQKVTAKLAEVALELETLEKELDVETARNAVAMEKLRSALDLADRDLQIAELENQVLLQGKRPRELADLERDVAIAAHDLSAAQGELDLKLELARKGHVAADEIKSLTEKRDEKRAAHALAKVKLELGIAGATPSDRKKSALKVQKARLTFVLSRRKLEIEEQTQSVARRKLGRRIETAREKVARYQSMLAGTTVTAPVSGTVVLGEKWSNEGPRKWAVGDSVQAGLTFMLLADQSSLRVSAVVPEEKIAGLRVGQLAQFWPLQSPGSRLDGTVALVAPVATEQRRLFGLFAGDRGFEVHLHAQATNLSFQPGLSVGCRIVIDDLRDVLLVPTGALHSDAQGTFVFLPGGQPRRVEVGPVGPRRSVILRGLEAGERILAPPEEAAS